MQNQAQTKKCDVTECCLNQSMMCQGEQACSNPQKQCHVGSCTMDACAFNNNMLCCAPSIDMGCQNGCAGCMTFKQR